MLDRYRLVERLGAGGFGVVWSAFDQRLEREVAVKILPADADGRAGEREARAAARLNHPGIVALYELGEDEEHVYLVSELVAGSTLGELERAGVLSDRDVARIGVALCDALAHAHERRVIHRDIKPGNVLVVAEPAAGAGFAKLADFGVAHLAGGDPLTRTGDVVGTLAYMAPEQAEGERVTAAADTYSLALTLYEALAGTNPVRARGPAATARRLGRRLPPLSRFRRDLPDSLCAALDGALEADPAARLPLPALRAALADAEPALDDAGGLVEPETQRRFGIARTSSLRRARTRVLSLREPIPDSATEDTHARAGLPARIGAAAAAALAVLLALGALGPEPPFSPLAGAAGAFAAVALLPRIGWLVAAAGLVAWLATPETGRAGTALVLLPALCAIPLLLPRAGPAWSVPALAPVLGIGALGPLYLALAALAAPPGRSAASTALRRAALGGLGFALLAAAELVIGEPLLFGSPAGVEHPEAWRDSPREALAGPLEALAQGPALAPAIVWALMPPLAALLVRGRSLALDLAGAIAWAGLLMAGHAAVADVAAGQVELGAARGAAAGAVLGAAVLVAAAGAGLWPRASGVQRPRSRMDAG